MSDLCSRVGDDFFSFHIVDNVVKRCWRKLINAVNLRGVEYRKKFHDGYVLDVPVVVFS